MKLGIVGGGAWGTALAVQGAHALGRACLCLRDVELADRINNRHINVKYLPNILLPKTLKATCCLDELFENDIIIFAIPSKYLLDFIDANSKKIRKNHILIIATKGLDHQKLQLFSSSIKNKLGNDNICILSGPNFAAEVANKNFSFASLASENFELATRLSKILSTESFIIRPSNDVISLQLSGCMKNIIAITIGISHGYGNGDNLRAFLIAQGANEIKKLSLLLGCNEQSFIDVASIGDLILTCTSMNSRNTNFGFQLSRSTHPKKFIDDFPYLVEGKESLETIHKLLKKLDIKLPIISNTYQLLNILSNKESVTHGQLNSIFNNFFSDIISSI